MEIIGFAIAQFILMSVGLIAGTIWWILARWRKGKSASYSAAGIGIIFIPVVALFYLEGCYIGYGLIEDAMGRDSYVEGIYHYPLVNGYRLVIMDKMPEQADIECDGRLRANGVSEVREFQVSGSIILVTSHRDVSGSDWGADKMADQFQIIDTSAGSIRSFGSLAELNSGAVQLGITPHMQTVQDALSKASAKSQPGWLFIPITLFPVLLLGMWYRSKKHHSTRTSSILISRQ
jgi:hypothetical protein